MAYSYTATTTSLGRGQWSVTISEADAGAGDEAVITNIPSSARLLKQVCSLVSGTGTTIDPVVGAVTNPTGVSVIAANDTAAADVNNIADPANPFFCTGTLYHRSNPDAGADNVISTIYLFKQDWE